MAPHRRKVVQPDGYLSPAGDDDAADFFNRPELVDRANDQFLVAFPEPPAGLVDVFGGEPLVDLPESESQSRQLRFVDLHLDFLDQTPLHAHRGHTGNRLQFPADFPVRQVAEHDQVFAGQAEAHDRVEFGVVSKQQRPFGILRQENPVHPLADVHNREVHVRIPVELQHHVGDAGARYGADFDQTVDDAYGFLDSPGNEVLDLFRRGAFVLGPHGQRRIGNVG